jgi:hypothetical protein
MVKELIVPQYNVKYLFNRKACSNGGIAQKRHKTHRKQVAK